MSAALCFKHVRYCTDRGKPVHTCFIDPRSSIWSSQSRCVTDLSSEVIEIRSIIFSRLVAFGAVQVIMWGAAAGYDVELFNLYVNTLFVDLSNINVDC